MTPAAGKKGETPHLKTDKQASMQNRPMGPTNQRLDRSQQCVLVMAKPSDTVGSSGWSSAPAGTKKTTSRLARTSETQQVFVLHNGGDRRGPPAILSQPRHAVGWLHQSPSTPPLAGSLAKWSLPYLPLCRNTECHRVGQCCPWTPPLNPARLEIWIFHQPLGCSGPTMVHLSPFQGEMCPLSSVFPSLLSGPPLSHCPKLPCCTPISPLNKGSLIPSLWS